RGRLLPPSPARDQEPVIMHAVEISPFAGVRLAAIAHRGDYHEINRAFEQAMLWASARGLLDAAMRSIGIYYDDPLTIPTKELRSEAGLVVADDVKLEGDVREVRIPSMRCASVL